MADHEVPELDRPEPDRSKTPRVRSIRAFEGADFADILRLTGGASVSAAMRSPWWFLVAAIYNVAAEPARDFLQDVRREAGPATGAFLADRILNGGKRGSSNPPRESGDSGARGKLLEVPRKDHSAPMPSSSRESKRAEYDEMRPSAAEPYDA
jgi:hypothetical protein